MKQLLSQPIAPTSPGYCDRLFELLFPLSVFPRRDVTESAVSIWQLN